MNAIDNDETLMTRVSNGDLNTLSFLFERYHIRIYNFLFRMLGDKELSEDLTQEVFYNIIKYKNSYNGNRFSTWVFTITRNLLSKQYSKRKLELIDIRIIEHKISTKQLDTIEEIEHLEESIKQLSFDDREIIILHKIEGIKYEELAKIMNTSPGAIKTKSHRAMKKLKEIYFKTNSNGKL